MITELLTKAPTDSSQIVPKSVNSRSLFYQVHLSPATKTAFEIKLDVKVPGSLSYNFGGGVDGTTMDSPTRLKGSPSEMATPWLKSLAVGSVLLTALGLVASIAHPGPVTGAAFPVGLAGMWLTSRLITAKTKSRSAA